MSASRRQFLATSAGLAGLAAMGCSTTPSQKGLPFRISLAEWSLHRTLDSGKMTNLDFPRVARADFGIEAIEYVNSFFKDKARDKAYLDELMKRCDGEGVKSLLIMVDGEGELAHEDEGERKKAVQNHHRWLDCAAYLGCHSIRVNAGGGGDEWEKQKRAADSLVQLACYADSTGLNVIVENHGGSSSKGAICSSKARGGSGAGSSKPSSGSCSARMEVPPSSSSQKFSMPERGSGAGAPRGAAITGLSMVAPRPSR